MTSSSFDKDMLFYQAIQNILIAYYIKVAYSNKNLYKTQRNQILKLIIKSYLNKSKYKLVKRDLKSLVIWEKQSGLPLESKILEVYDLAEKYYINSDINSDLSKLYQSFNHLRKLCSLNVDAIEIDEIRDTYTLYVVKSDILQAFDDIGTWKGRSIRFLVPNDKRNEVVRYFKKTHLKVEKMKLKSPFHICFYLRLK